MSENLTVEEAQDQATKLFDLVKALRIELEQYSGPGEHSKSRWEATILIRDAERYLFSVQHYLKILVADIIKEV